MCPGLFEGVYSLRACLGAFSAAEILVLVKLYMTNYIIRDTPLQTVM
jgi:hypothetical protein